MVSKTPLAVETVEARRLGTLLSSASSALSFVATGLALMLAARALVPSSFGEIAAGFALAMMISAVSTLSLGQVAHFVATSEPGTWRRTMPWLVFFLTFGSASLVALVIVGLRLADIVPGLSSLPLAVVLSAGVVGLLLAIELNMMPLMAAAGQLAEFNGWRLTGRVLTVIGSATFAFSHLPTWTVLATHGCGPLLAVWISHASFLRKVPGSASRSDVAKLLKGTLVLHPGAMGTFALSWLNILLLSSLSSPTESGFYLTAWSLVQVILTAPQGAMAAIMGHVASEGPDLAWRNGRGELVVFFLLSLAGMGLGLVLVGYLVTPVFGEAYRPVIGVFRALAFVIPGASIGLLMSPQWIGRGLFGISSLISLAIGLVNVGLCFVLAPSLGAVGAAWSSVAAYTLSLAFQLVFIVRLSRRSRVAPA